MSRIPWTRHDGDDVEAVISMLLCGESFDAWRIRPGQGDGGIDVLSPIDGDLQRRRIYQVKRYAETLSSSQKRKIKRSLDRVVATAKDENWQLESWHLVMPLDPTPANLNWFQALTANLQCAAEWIGLNRIEYLATKHPAVIDYYLRDGKERLAMQQDRLLGILAGRSKRAAGEPLRPEDIRGDLADTYRAINECDPHYRYSISVAPTPPTDDHWRGTPGLVGISSSGSDAEGWVTIGIYARSRAALEERPITAKVEFLSADESVAEEYREFLTFGTPVTLPPGSVTAQLDLPGGMAVDLERATVAFAMPDEEADDDEELELMVAIISPDRDVLAEVPMTRTHANSIPTGGRRTVWEDAAKFVRLEIVAKKYPDLIINISSNVAPAGRRPDDIAASLRFVSHLHDPNTFGFSQTFGPRNWSVGTVTGSSGSRDPMLSAWAMLAAALSTIQQHTSQRLRFPNELTREQAIQIRNAARILSGEPVAITWEEGLRIDRLPDDGLQLDFAVGDRLTARITGDLTITIDGTEIVVGKQMAIVEGLVTECSDSVLAAEPATNSKSWFMRYDGDDENRSHVHVAHVRQEEGR